MNLIFYFYHYILSPIFVLIFFLVFPFNKKLRKSFQLRSQTSQRPRWTTQPVWIHASSGEFEYAKSVIRDFKKENPNVPVLVTFFSPSYAQAVAQFPGVDYSEPLPFDLPQSVIAFLKHFRPKALLVARTDLWPEVLFQCRRMQIPVLLFTTTFRPLKGYRKLFKPFYVFLFQMAQDIFCVSRYDVENLKIISSASAKGDTRYDQVNYRMNHLKAPNPVITNNMTTLTLVVGSSWPQDEQRILPAILPFLIDKKYKLIIAPHEPSSSRINNIINFFKKNNVDHQLYSLLQPWQTPVLIVDQVGLLADLYAFGDVAFVGGSFKQKVHSVMEPLGHGLLTVVGPKFHNNREATEFHNLASYRKISAVTCCKNTDEIIHILDFIFKNKDYVTELKGWIQTEFKKRLGATEHVLAWLRPYIK